MKKQLAQVITLALTLGLGAVSSATAQSQAPAPSPRPVWPLDISSVARAKSPVIGDARNLYNRFTGPTWRAAHTVTVNVRNDSPSLNLFCGRQSGSIQIDYVYAAPAPDDIVSARMDTAECANRAAQGVTDALLTFRDGSAWAGQVDIQRNRALPVRPRGNRPGALVMPDGSVLVSLGLPQFDRVLGEGEYRYDAWIHPDGTMIANQTAPGYPLEPRLSSLISRTHTPWYVSQASLRRNAYRGPPVFIQSAPTIASLYLPGGLELDVGYTPSAGAYLGRLVENAGPSEGFETRTGRSVVPIVTLTHSQGGYTVTGEYSFSPDCEQAPPIFALQFSAPLTEEQPIDETVAGWRCGRLELIGAAHITTFGRTLLGPAGVYYAPFGSIAIGRGPRLGDMIVSSQRSRIVPVSGRQHGLTPYARRGEPHHTRVVFDGTPADYQNHLIRNDSGHRSFLTGIRQRYDAVLGALDAPIIQQRADRRAAERRRADFWFNLSSAAAGAAVSYNQQRDQQALDDAARRASIARHMAADLASRADITGGQPRARGAYDDPAARRAEQNRILAEESAGRARRDNAALAEQARRDEEASAAAAARLAEQSRLAEAEAVAAREQVRRERDARPAPSGSQDAQGDSRGLYLTVRPAEPSTPAPTPPPASAPSTTTPRPPAPRPAPPPPTGTARPM